LLPAQSFLMDDCITGQLVLGVGQAEYSKIVADMEDGNWLDVPEHAYDFNEKEKEAWRAAHVKIKREEAMDWYLGQPVVQMWLEYYDRD